MSGSRWLCLSVFFLCTISSCSQGSSGSLLKSEGYSIQFDDNPLSEKWGHYLYRHLSRRTQERGIVYFNKIKKDFLNIEVRIDHTQSHDYRIMSDDSNRLLLSAKSEEVMLWLIYQFIEKLSTKDERFVTDDLPPSILNFDNTEADFDFLYREPHFYSNLSDSEYAPVIGAHNVDNDWGIWGHNLRKVLYADIGNNIYAKQDNRVNKEQFCFSSEEIYHQLEEYVLDNYGDSHGYIQRFMIMPNDNDIVCECEKCLKNGNTSKNATPALSVLINRLALRFPNHQFFTTAYLTTVIPPADKWLENTGVMISTIDIPKGVVLKNQKEVKNFLYILNKWKINVPSVYIWDYAANFDDYLTPIPVLYGLKKQLAFYKSAGVKGVFLNANGYDYSPFDDMKTFVAASLMINADLSVDSLCHAFLLKSYPQTGGLLADYYLSLERKFEYKNKAYNIYAGFDEIADTYLDMDDFVAFYNLLESKIPESKIPESKNTEKEKLKKLFVALTFTRLQIAYKEISGVYGFADTQNKQLVLRPVAGRMLNTLLQHKQFENFLNYKEVDGALKLYIAGWNNMLQDVLENKLLGESISILSKQSHAKINRLNDGVKGFAESYHQGWYINDKDLHICFNGQNVNDAKKVTVNFLVDKNHRIYSPAKMIIFKDKKEYMEVIPEIGKKDKLQIVQTEIDVDFTDTDMIEIKIVKNEGKGSFACDEIWIN